MAADGSGLPLETWAGLDMAGVEKLMSSLAIPPRSPALNALWHRLLTSGTSAPQGVSAQQFLAIRVEGLYRSGLLKEASRLLASANAGSDPVLQILSARQGIALGEREAGCAAARAASDNRSALPPVLRGELLVLTGYCGAAGGNLAAAGLAAELAREEGFDDAVALAVLDAVAAQQPPAVGRQARVSPIQYRLLQLTKAGDPTELLDHADAALLAVLAGDKGTEPHLRLAAAEAAARLNVVGPDDLAAVYRDQKFAPQELADPSARTIDPLSRRALFLQAAEREPDPQRKARLIRALLDDSRRTGTYRHVLTAVASMIQEVPRAPELEWFSETAIEAALASGDLEAARSWAKSASRGYRSSEHWLALADIASPRFGGPRGGSLAAVEELALAGRLSPPLLHRLVTVLDALDYQVPMNLWQVASSTPQPNDGYLPETGILPALLDASQNRQYARTVLLAMTALGPAGPEGAHIIALGDTIRALRRAGLEAEARRLGFDAIFISWPRTVN